MRTASGRGSGCRWSADGGGGGVGGAESCVEVMGRYSVEQVAQFGQGPYACC